MPITTVAADVAEESAFYVETMVGDLIEDEQFCMRALQQMQAFEKQYNPAAVNITENVGQRADSLQRKDSSKK